MNFNCLPQCLGLGLSICAFAVVWSVGLLCGVPTHRLALRAIAAAGCFWLFGLLAGRALLNGLCDAIGERLYRTRGNKERNRGGTK